MKLMKKDFFETEAPTKKPAKPIEEIQGKKVKKHPEKHTDTKKIEKEKIRFIDNTLKDLIEKTDELCKRYNQAELSNEVNQIKNYLQSAKFTVTVVGEFSRGKSTLINQLLGEEVMPVGNLPTTAMLTKITYNDIPMMVHINEKGRKRQLPLTAESWEDLTANIDGDDAKGVIYTGITNQWLLDHDIEYIDTPGAGDLQDKRIEYVNQAIMTSDCAIITISAANPLSLTEKMFLEERILSRQIPRIMLVITKLDLISKEERENVLLYVKNKISEWNIKVPIFVTYEDSSLHVEGIEAGILAIKTQLETWVKDAEHLKRKNKTAYTALDEILSVLKLNIETKLSFFDLEKDKRKEAAKKQKDNIKGNEIHWEDLQTQMLMRCNNNFEWMNKLVTEKQDAIVERIKYELDHTSNPKEWWEKDYPYRLKMEMIALGATLENGLQQLYSKDVAWLNNILDHDYQMNVMQQRETMADRELFKKWNESEDVGLKDLKKGRLITRIGTGVATLGGYVLFGAFGLAPLGSAVGIGGGIISEFFLNKNVAAQKDKLLDIIDADVPKVIDKAVVEVEHKIRKAYEAVTDDAKQKEAVWLNARYTAIDAALDQVDNSNEHTIKEEYDAILKLKTQMNITE